MKLQNYVWLLVCSMMMHFSVTAQGDLLNTLKGVWEQEGYGRIMNIDEQGIHVYDICKVSCTANEELTWQEAKQELRFENITDSSFTVRSGINKENFIRLVEMPDLCVKQNASMKDDPIYNFESLWHTFNEQYCYFETRNIDWDAMKEKYRSKLNPNTSPLELYIVLSEMLEEMKDGHVFIVPPPKLRKEYIKYKKQQAAIKEQVEPKKKTKRKSINIDKVLRRMFNYYVDDVKNYHAGNVIWGKINEDIGLVRMNGMGGLANYKIPEIYPETIFEKAYDKKAEKSKHYMKDEIDGVQFVMNKVLKDFEQAKYCIIDLRFNGGGFDEVALELLSYFTPKATEVFTKKAFLNPGYTAKNIVSITPAKKVFQGQVFILTSHHTASAAEIFTMSSIKANPNAIRIGSNTEGIFSDILEKKLPNAWTFGLSNEIYETMDGTDYENKGIPPHHDLGYKKDRFWFLYQLKEGLTNGDAAIEKVLDIIKKQ